MKRLLGNPVTEVNGQPSMRRSRGCSAPAISDWAKSTAVCAGWPAGASHSAGVGTACDPPQLLSRIARSCEAVVPSPLRSASGLPHALSRIERSAEFTTPSPLRSAAFAQLPQVAIALSAQVKSHIWSQQKGSAVQTSAQHCASLQPGVSFGSQQVPVRGFPHSDCAQSVQSWAAMPAHRSSHCTVQQKSSALQTAAQQSASLHAGERCSTQQLPAFGSPQDCAHPVGVPRAANATRAIAAAARWVRSRASGRGETEGEAMEMSLRIPAEGDSCRGKKLERAARPSASERVRGRWRVDSSTSWTLHTD